MPDLTYEQLDEIARRWSRNGGMGNDRSEEDYTDAGCRVLARAAFRDVPALVAELCRLRAADQRVRAEERRKGWDAARAVVERQTDLAELAHFERPSDFRKGILTSLAALDGSRDKALAKLEVSHE